MSRTKEFIKKHPICCFCGGVKPSATIDHVPARSLFTDRQWPVGYEFPACSSCNKKTRDSERLISVLSRAFPDPSTEYDRRFIEAQFKDISANDPALMLELLASDSQYKKFKNEFPNTEIGPDNDNNPSLISVKGPLVTNYMDLFTTKLFCALHYHHSGKSITLNGGIAMKWWTNVNLMRGEIPRNIVKVITNAADLVRNNKRLNDQFEYFYHCSEDSELGSYLCLFRSSLWIWGGVNRSIAKFPEYVNVLKPFYPTGTEFKKVSND